MLRPTTAHCHFVFECPECHQPTELTLKEWKHIGRAICWSCQHLLEMEPIDGIVLSPKYLNVTEDEVEGEDRNKAVAALVVMGYKQESAQKFVDEQEYCPGFINHVTTKACEEL